MKKIILLMAVTVSIISCGGKEDKKAGTETKTETEKKEPVNDLSDNPDYQKGLALISKPGNLCLTCHKIDEKLTGPAYRDVANKYENTEANVKMLAAKVIKGGTGVWGEIAMPANTSVTEEEAEAIVKYILLLKK
jgi:cytochrome c